ncbi:MAG TPA: GTPase Era [Casimicrobiaceae bacterium]|nr:GTPase Era [Casimicrobiaceae bacterium]
MADAAFRCGYVAVVGRPNVGKSTLVNALVGARVSITSRRPQTTRHRILGIVSAPGAQLVFIDTPGFQGVHRSRLNQRMNRCVRQAVAGVDAIVVVLEAVKLTDGDREVLALLPARVPAIAAVNKIDRLADKSRLLPYLAMLGDAHAFAAMVPVSAEKGTQLDVLTAEIAHRLPVAEPLFAADDLTDRDERFLAAEYVREKIFRRLGEEVPYATTVAVDRFEHDGALRRIHATVYADKASQRAILLGEGGATMKAIAAAARRDMERLFGGKVFLEVWVKVRSGWADDEAMLERLGY